MTDRERTLHEDPTVALQLAARRELADEWALVLISQGMSPRVRRSSEGWVVAVPLEEAAAAAATLAAYLHENPEPQDRAVVSGHETSHEADRQGLHTALVVSVALLAFFMLTGPRNPEIAWFARGSADAERMLAGELWRAVTALTLHADLAHVLSNSIMGALLLTALCRSLGSGLGLLLMLAAGALGNELNALLQTPNHVSVGASTAVFGALGVLGALAVARRRETGQTGRRAWVPVAAGLGILAMLGTGGARVDLWAHLLGFGCGAAIGLLYTAVPRPVPGPAAQRQLMALSLAIVAGCWVLAFR